MWRTCMAGILWATLAATGCAAPAKGDDRPADRLAYVQLDAVFGLRISRSQAPVGGDKDLLRRIMVGPTQVGSEAAHSGDAAAGPQRPLVAVDQPLARALLVELRARGASVTVSAAARPWALDRLRPNEAPATANWLEWWLQAQARGGEPARELPTAALVVHEASLTGSSEVVSALWDAKGQLVITVGGHTASRCPADTVLDVPMLRLRADVVGRDGRLLAHVDERRALQPRGSPTMRIVHTTWRQTTHASEGWGRSQWGAVAVECESMQAAFAYLKKSAFEREQLEAGHAELARAVAGMLVP